MEISCYFLLLCSHVTNFFILYLTRHDRAPKSLNAFTLLGIVQILTHIIVFNKPIKEAWNLIFGELSSGTWFTYSEATHPLGTSVHLWVVAIFTTLSLIFIFKCIVKNTWTFNSNKEISAVAIFLENIQGLRKKIIPKIINTKVLIFKN